MERFFSISIPENLKHEMLQKLNIETIKSKASKYENFHQYDSVTHIYGRHVSPLKGQPHYYKNFFSSNQKYYLQSMFKEYIESLDYE